MRRHAASRARRFPTSKVACVVGIGVNCAHAPEAVGYPTATLGRDDGGAIEASELFERLVARFDEALDLWARGEGFPAVRAAWLDHAAGLGTVVRIEGVRGRREGAFEGLDADGRLLFRGEGGTEAIEAADLWISPDPDDAAPCGAARFARAGRPSVND